MLKRLYSVTEGDFLVKIAIELERALEQRAANGSPGKAAPRLLACGDGWTVEDVICTSGPRDRAFEERHSRFCIAIVAAGTFQYRAQTRFGTLRELMTPGSLLLGNIDQYFECGHEHGAGDRCLALGYSAEYFERLAFDAGRRGGKAAFGAVRVPPLRDLAPFVARGLAGLTRSGHGVGEAAWEELSVRLAARTVQLLSGAPIGAGKAPPYALARVTRTIRMIERHPDSRLTLGSMAREAGLSPYHFLRTFMQLTGVTPHQFVLRSRLREAATRLADSERSPSERVLDIGLDCGFGDVSNFDRAFRAEFGVTPRVWRRLNGNLAIASAVNRSLTARKRAVQARQTQVGWTPIRP